MFMCIQLHVCMHMSMHMCALCMMARGQAGCHYSDAIHSLQVSGWLSSDCCNQLESLMVNVPSGFILK